jgi:hypothetical protein
MAGLIFGIIFLIVAFVLPRILKAFALPAILVTTSWMAPSGAALVTLGNGALAYNDAGYCQHIRTVWGSETSTCKAGWFVKGWGYTNAWPHFITVAHTDNMNAEGSSISGSYNVRMSDNWTGDVTQTTRFGIPQDSEQFIKMARDFRSPERLISTTLRPSVTAAIDTVANMFTMEQYYSGRMRDTFKIEFKDTIEKGQPLVEVKEINVDNPEVSRAASSALAAAQDSSDVGDTDGRLIVTEKVRDENGKEIRTQPEYLQYGILVSQAILEKIEADPAFEEQQKKRKEAASRRVIAKEQRLEQEEQRLLEIANGETEIARRQAQAKTEQIQATTDAETKKKLALIEATRMKEEAEIQRETAKITLERARIDAEAVQVSADAEAYAKEAILTADGALQQKLDAWLESQRVWADAASKINVPTTIFTNGGAEGGNAGSAMGTVEQFMSMMTMKAAKDLQVDPTITK